MYKVPYYFGEVTNEQIEQISTALSDYDKYMAKFQKRENKTDSDDSIKLVRGPRLKCYTCTRVKG